MKILRKMSKLLFIAAILVFTVLMIPEETPGAKKSSKTALNKVSIKSIERTAKGVELSWSSVEGATGYEVLRGTSSAVSKMKRLGTVTALKYRDDSAVSGTAYYYRVRAVAKANGKTVNKGAESAAKKILVIHAPASLSISKTASGIKLKWSKVSKASGYFIYRKTGSGSWKKIATVNDGAVTYTNKKLTNGSKYQYKVRAYIGDETGAYSKTVLTYWLSKPSITSLKSTVKGKITVKWKDNVKASGYEIRYSLKSDMSDSTKTGTTGLSKTVSGLKAGKKYYVQLRTYRNVNSKKYYSVWSTAKSVTVSKGGSSAVLQLLESDQTYSYDITGDGKADKIRAEVIYGESAYVYVNGRVCLEVGGRYSEYYYYRTSDSNEYIICSQIYTGGAGEYFVYKWKDNTLTYIDGLPAGYYCSGLKKTSDGLTYTTSEKYRYENAYLGELQVKISFSIDSGKIKLTSLTSRPVSGEVEYKTGNAFYLLSEAGGTESNGVYVPAYESVTVKKACLKKTIINEIATWNFAYYVSYNGKTGWLPESAVLNNIGN